MGRQQAWHLEEILENVQLQQPPALEERITRLKTRSYAARLLEKGSDGILLTKPDGTILATNPQMCQMLGMTEKELKRVGIQGTVVKKEHSSSFKEIGMADCARVELTFKRKNGTIFESEVSSSLFADIDGVTKKIIVVRDITNLKKTEYSLKENIRLNQVLLDAFPSIAFLISPQYPRNRSFQPICRPSRGSARQTVF